MFNFSDLFQWERFITPSIIKLFYWLALILVGLSGLSGIVSALGMMMLSPALGFVTLLGSLLLVVIGVIFCRISAEFILIVFRINEHLGAIRSRAEQ
jgi:ammonia channel protein AmtB